MINLDEITNEVRVEDRFKYKNYNCIVTLSDYGWRAAYIILPSSNKYCHKDLHELTDIECHGGITFSANNNPAFELQGGSWIIGFDFDHYGDNYDLRAVKKLFGDRVYREAESFMKNPTMIDCHTNGRNITLEMVEDELKKVVDQIDNSGKAALGSD